MARNYSQKLGKYKHGVICPTVLKQAAIKNKPDIFKKLHRKYPDFLKKTNTGAYLAISNMHKKSKITKILKNYKRKIKKQDILSALMILANSNSSSSIYIKTYNRYNKKFNLNNTEILPGLPYQHTKVLEIVDFLLKKGHSPDKNNHEAIFTSIYSGNSKATELLIENTKNLCFYSLSYYYIYDLLDYAYKHGKIVTALKLEKILQKQHTKDEIIKLKKFLKNIRRIYSYKNYIASKEFIDLCELIMIQFKLPENNNDGFLILNEDTLRTISTFEKVNTKHNSLIKNLVPSINKTLITLKELKSKKRDSKKELQKTHCYIKHNKRVSTN